VSPKISRVLLALVVALISLGVRLANETRLMHGPGVSGEWATLDPDGHYHMRRLERALEDGGRVAGTDPWLAYPDGAKGDGTAIPWPPYATQILWLGAARFAPDDPQERREFIERYVGTAPLIFSVLVSALLALAAASLVGREGEESSESVAWGAGLAAGLYHAFSFGAVRYGNWGMGDHHALVALFETLLFLGVGVGLARGWRIRGGIFVGLVLGLALGTWVASALYGAIVAIAIGAATMRAGSRGRIAAHLGTGLCAGALVAVFPAVMASPWTGAEWLNLSTVHAACLMCGIIVFRAAAWMSSDARRRGLLGVVALLIVLVLGIPGTAPADGLRAGLNWSGASSAFMGRINESQPLALSGALVWKWLGFGLVVVPIAVGAAFGHVTARGRIALLPWVVATPVLLWMAFEQRRFAEAAIVPLAVLFGWMVASLARYCLRSSPAWTRWIVLTGLFGLLANLPFAWDSGLRLTKFGSLGETLQMQQHRGLRELATLLRDQPGDGAVLAHWDRGHLIEWVGGRPTVATGFGSYLGEDAFLDPWRFFLETDPQRAEQILIQRDIRFVLAEHPATHSVDSMAEAIHPSRARLWTASAADGTAPWIDSMAARLSNADATQLGRDVGFLRLIARKDHGFLYERVVGAVIEIPGAAGARLDVRARIPMVDGGGPDFEWKAHTIADADGVARLRVPYATRADGAGAVFWTFGDRSGQNTVSPEAVAEGSVVPLR
jgi:hypothetical protein